MALNDYHFITRWRVRATPELTYDIVADAPGLARWWPSVYLDVNVLEPGDAAGVGRVVDLYTKGWLPYTLRWRFKTLEARRPTGLKIEAIGDFVGTGEWTFSADAEHCDIVFDWRIKARKPLLRWLSPLLKPIFRWNHFWAMARGLESLKLEIQRRQAPDDAARAKIPPPPAATFRSRGS